MRIKFWKKKPQKSFNEFLEDIPDFELMQKYSKRETNICGQEFSDLTFLPYDLLKHTIPDLIQKYEYERVIFEIARIRNNYLNFNDVEQESNYKKVRFIFWVNDQYELINELEQKYLTSPPNAKLVNAGIKELDILGDVNLIDQLAGGDILKWQEIRKLPYSMIFDKQFKITIEKRINEKLEKENG